MQNLTKRLGIALALSVGINLFLVGAITTHLLRRPPTGPPMRDRDGGQFLFRATEGMSPEGRSTVRAIMKRHRSGLMPRRKAMRQARRDVQTALEKEPFDRALLKRNLARLRGETSSAQEELHEAMSEAAGNMSAADRKELTRSMARYRGPGRRPQR